MFEDIFDMFGDIFYWPVICESPLYKLYIVFQTRSDTQTSFLLDRI